MKKISFVLFGSLLPSIAFANTWSCVSTCNLYERNDDGNMLRYQKIMTSSGITMADAYKELDRACNAFSDEEHCSSYALVPNQPTAVCAKD